MQIEKISKKHHMKMPWHSLAKNNVKIIDANLSEKASVIGRIGIILLASGTGAWRVRYSMNSVARVLGVTCSADIGLTSIELTCVETGNSYTQALSVSNSGLNTDKLGEIENFVNLFQAEGINMTTEEIHTVLDHIQNKVGNYSEIIHGLAAALACCAFTFLLGGGPIEMFCAFIGSGCGNWIRNLMTKKQITLFAKIAVSVATACLIYALSFYLLRYIFQISANHEAGYIGAMLFIVPGVPFVTSGLDIAKMDMRSGIERLAQAIVIVSVSTLVGWICALLVHLKPESFNKLSISLAFLVIFRLIASFCGVFGFSLMFNSKINIATAAGIIGAIANTCRLELVDLLHYYPALAAFIGAFIAGILAAIFQRKLHCPIIAITVPSIVIMVPGLYMYHAVYELGINSLVNSAFWFTQAALIVIFLPLGLIAARILTDDKWRYAG